MAKHVRPVLLPVHVLHSREYGEELGQIPQYDFHLGRDVLLLSVVGRVSKERESVCVL